MKRVEKSVRKNPEVAPRRSRTKIMTWKSCSLDLSGNLAPLDLHRESIAIFGANNIENERESERRLMLWSSNDGLYGEEDDDDRVGRRRRRRKHRN